MSRTNAQDILQVESINIIEFYTKYLGLCPGQISKHFFSKINSFTKKIYLKNLKALSKTKLIFIKVIIIER